MEDRERLTAAFTMLTDEERQLFICALAGNHPQRLSYLRPAVLRGLARAKHDNERMQASAEAGAMVNESLRQMRQRR
jgi:hypothetical protein